MRAGVATTSPDHARDAAKMTQRDCAALWPIDRFLTIGKRAEATRQSLPALPEEAFADFLSLDIREHDNVIREGTAHSGMSALIDLVGRK
jgi:hypothetical protein